MHYTKRFSVKMRRWSFYLALDEANVFFKRFNSPLNRIKGPFLAAEFV